MSNGDATSCIPSGPLRCAFRFRRARAVYIREREPPRAPPPAPERGGRSPGPCALRARWRSHTQQSQRETQTAPSTDARPRADATRRHADTRSDSKTDERRREGHITADEIRAEAWQEGPWAWCPVAACARLPGVRRTRRSRRGSVMAPHAQSSKSASGSPRLPPSPPLARVPSSSPSSPCR